MSLRIQVVCRSATDPTPWAVQVICDTWVAEWPIHDAIVRFGYQRIAEVLRG